MTRFITIPVEMLGTVRSALLSELGGAAQLIASASTTKGQRYEWFREPVEHFNAYRAALDAIGWEVRQGLVTIDLTKHRWALVTALEVNLSVERDYMAIDPHVEGAARQIKKATRNARLIEAFLAGLPSAEGEA